VVLHRQDKEVVACLRRHRAVQHESPVERPIRGSFNLWRRQEQFLAAGARHGLQEEIVYARALIGTENDSAPSGDEVGKLPPPST
jgi:hypothetical protein